MAERTTTIMPAPLAVPGFGRRFAAELKAAIGHHLLLFFAAAIVLAAGYALALASGSMLSVSPLKFAEKYVVNAAVIVLIVIFIHKFLLMVVVERPDSALRELLRWFRDDILSPQRLANGLCGMGAVFMLMGGFTMAKNTVSRFGGFHWDRQLSAFDQYLHFGAFPHDILQALLGHPAVTALIDGNYVLWFPVLFASFFAVSFQNERSLHRHRFILAMIMSWAMGGIVLAVAFSSAGPVYFEKVTGLASPYASHFAYLMGVDGSHGLKALDIQDQLWTNYAATPSLSLISAFPSMHTAVATLVALGCFSAGRLLRYASLGFAMLIAVGSVHLGWHYAADTYAGLLIAVAAWYAALPISRWYVGVVRP